MKYLVSYYRKQFLSIFQMSTMLADIYEHVQKTKVSTKYLKTLNAIMKTQMNLEGSFNG